MVIDKNRTYRTRDGREVRIYATDGTENQEIHGAVKSNGEWNLCAWHSDGIHARYDLNGPRDLIEVRPRHKRTVWLNVYEHVTQGCYESKWEADSCAGKDRIACIKVELDFEEGQGL